MPVLERDTYTIDFAVLENNDPKTIVLLDKSNYLEEPQNPILQILFPGYVNAATMSYNPNSIITIDSVSIQEPFFTDSQDLADLPDGVYQIKMQVCPYDVFYKKLCHLKTTSLECKYSELLINIDSSCCLSGTKLYEELIEVDILIQSAKAEARIANVQKASEKYTAALAKVNNLIKKRNCK